MFSNQPWNRAGAAQARQSQIVEGEEYLRDAADELEVSLDEIRELLAFLSLERKNWRLRPSPEFRLIAITPADDQPC